MGGIHSTVPKSEKETKADAHVIARRLRMVTHRMMGKANAMTSDRLAALCGIEPKGTNQIVRKAAKILLCEEHVPIVSCSAGFYIAVEAKELIDYKQNLTGRLLALQRDIAAVNTILVRRGKKQAEMFE